MNIVEAICWKYGNVADTVDGKITAWRHVALPQPTEIELQAVLNEYIAYRASTLYKEKREKEYDSVGDQLDRITKFLKHLKANGVDIGADGDEQVARCEAVKAKYPKLT